MKKILFIPAQFYPIPAVKDGAVEVLMTQLIEENEKHSRASFFVVSKYDKEARKTKYKNTKVFYIKNNFIDVASFLIVKFFRKTIFNKLTRPIFKNKKNCFKELTFFAFKCNRIAKRIKPDIIVSEGYDKIHRLWPLEKWFSKTNCYYHLHYVREEKIETRIMFPNTIAISDFVLKHWVKDLSISGKNIVLYNGIDLASFEKEIELSERERLRKELNLDKHDFVVLFVGRLRPHKGVYQLLKAFDEIGTSNIKLLIAGAFLSESREHNLDENEFETNCLNIINKNKNIIWAGNVVHDKISRLYQISDIQVIPSMWEEGAGVVAIEGMASGLPLIITNSGGMVEYTGNECAIILDRDKSLIPSLSESILRLYNDQNLYLYMSMAGRERAKAFSKQNYYRNYMDFLLSEK